MLPSGKISKTFYRKLQKALPKGFSSSWASGWWGRKSPWGRGPGAAPSSTKAEASSVGTALFKAAPGCGPEEASEDLAPSTAASATQPGESGMATRPGKSPRVPDLEKTCVEVVPIASGSATQE